MKRLSRCKYNVHDIVNKLYRTIPLVPVGTLMQDIAQDIQMGLYNDCGDPNTNWQAWMDKTKKMLSERNVIDVMDNRNHIYALPIDKPDCKYIREAKIKKLSDNLYTWQEVCDITNNAGGRIYSSPFGNYDNYKFKLEQVPFNKISPDYYLTIKDCDELNLDEDKSVIERLLNTYDSGQDLPPIILDNNYKIIDGSHRMGVYEYLGLANIKAFVIQKDN